MQQTFWALLAVFCLLAVMPAGAGEPAPCLNSSSLCFGIAPAFFECMNCPLPPLGCDVPEVPGGWGGLKHIWA